MIYIIVQEWKNTKGNHAGMVYLANRLEIDYRNSIKVIIVPDLILWSSWRFFLKIQFKIQRFVYNIYYFFLGLFLVVKLSKTDRIFLFEYLLKDRNQEIIARLLRFFRKKAEIGGLVHLTPTGLVQIYSCDEVKLALGRLDLVLTLGSGLSDFLGNYVSNSMVKTLFHYVDNKFYSANNRLPNYSEILKVVIIGMQMRDIDLIRRIVSRTPCVQYILFSGVWLLSDDMLDLPNLKVQGFVDEDSLKQAMGIADVSLSCLTDTVGSNVITTSLSMGLVNVVSDVGSIRDYCSEEDSILCHDEDSIVMAIKALDSDRDFLERLSLNSSNKSKIFSYEVFRSRFTSL